jgi:crotonobetainyl-CoA:carnitine CoA-transferase CaiB-like acyl-CoA transferase
MYIDLAQAETGAALMAPLYLDALNGGPDWSYPANTSPGSLLSAVLRCRGDDEWAAVDIEDIQDWNVLCEILERPDLGLLDCEIDEPPPTSDLLLALEKWSINSTANQVALRLQKVGLAAAPVTNSEDLWRNPQLRSRQAFVEVHHPDLGTIEYPESPDRLELTPGRVRCAGPRLGEHSRSVIAEWLGATEEEISQLRSSDAFWEPDESSK